MRTSLWYLFAALSFSSFGWSNPTNNADYLLFNFGGEDAAYKLRLTEDILTRLERNHLTCQWGKYPRRFYVTINKTVDRSIWKISLKIDDREHHELEQWHIEQLFRNFDDIFLWVQNYELSISLGIGTEKLFPFSILNLDSIQEISLSHEDVPDRPIAFCSFYASLITPISE